MAGHVYVFLKFVFFFLAFLQPLFVRLIFSISNDGHF